MTRGRLQLLVHVVRVRMELNRLDDLLVDLREAKSQLSRVLQEVSTLKRTVALCERRGGRSQSSAEV